MAQGEFDRSLLILKERAQVWVTITDVQVVASWISIVGSVSEEEHLRTYKAVLEDRLGPFRLKADLTISMSAVEEGERLEARAEGTDRQMGSRLIIEGSLSLDETEEGTILHLHAWYNVTGKVASLGDSMIRRKAAKVVEEFFTNAESEFGSSDDVKGR